MFVVARAAQASLIVQKTAKEVIWGWEDPLLTLLHTLNLSPSNNYRGIVLNDTSLEASLEKHGRMRMYTGKVTTNLARNLLGSSPAIYASYYRYPNWCCFQMHDYLTLPFVQNGTAWIRCNAAYSVHVEIQTLLAG
jgi:hypothetical protein